MRWALGLGFLMVAAACSQPPPEPTPAPTPQARRGPEGEGPQGGRVGRMQPSPDELDQVRALCAEPLVLPTEGFTDPLTDAHVHVPLRVDQGPFALALLRDMNQYGVTRAMVQPDHSPEMTQNQGLMGAVRKQEAAWGTLAEACSRLVPMVYAFDPADPAAVDYARPLLESGRYGGIGEMEFQHGRMGIAHPPDSEAMQTLYGIVAEQGLAVHFQADLEEAPADLGPRLKATIEGHPKVRFVWFACGRELFHWELPNLWCGAFIHPDVHAPPDEVVARSLLGTDTGPHGFPAASKGAVPYDDLGTAMTGARESLGALPPEVARAAASGNFDAVFPKER
ncbi:MAG: hypothetical protein GY898_22330 [Proteobacteria bacterium]|nr:hypothetical protein [Pseudomonadota bacterium]